MKVTADTITDEQIRELRDSELMNASADERWRIFYATRALGESRWYAGVDCRMPHGLEARCIREGREYCARILNARAEVSR